MSHPSALADPAKLRACWHPVAWSADVADRPVGTRLLGESLAVWRDRSGTLHAVSDLCIHRGTALSLGWIDGDEIVCPYHGWHYGANGACTLIPQLEDPTRIPAKARIQTYECRERYGMVWVALEPARFDLPEIPEFDEPDWRLVPCGPYTWECDSSRQVENFTDFGHFPWVHPGLLGDPSRPVVPRHEVETRDHVLHYSVVRPEAPNSDEYPVFSNDETEAPMRRSLYELHLPYTILLRVGWGAGEGMIYFFASQPVAADRSAGFLVVGRNYNLDQPDEVLVGFEETIFSQDKTVVESQRPERVPFDLADELHLKFDAVAVAYRRAMRSVGLA
jgi:phenylpropionate dioxygenase-like ring-hydroxylating dioxygenase large terminal subunit